MKGFTSLGCFIAGVAVAMVSIWSIESLRGSPIKEGVILGLPTDMRPQAAILNEKLDIAHHALGQEGENLASPEDVTSAINVVQDHFTRMKHDLGCHTRNVSHACSNLLLAEWELEAHTAEYNTRILQAYIVILERCMFEMWSQNSFREFVENLSGKAARFGIEYLSIQTLAAGLAVIGGQLQRLDLGWNI